MRGGGWIRTSPRTIQSSAVARFETPSQSSRSPTASYKCLDDNCIHYVYGFHSEDDRDYHVREHALTSRRDSALLPSITNTPTLTFPDNTSSRSLGGETPRRSSTFQLPKPPVPTPLRSLSIPSQLSDSDRKDSFPGVSFQPDSLPRQRSFTEADVDPLLPPLRFSRAGQSRLQSIGELKLPSTNGSCLRCTVKNFAVNIRLCWLIFGLGILTVSPVRFKRRLPFLSSAGRARRL